MSSGSPCGDRNWDPTLGCGCGQCPQDCAPRSKGTSRMGLGATGVFRGWGSGLEGDVGVLRLSLRDLVCGHVWPWGSGSKPRVGLEVLGWGIGSVVMEGLEGVVCSNGGVWGSGGCQPWGMPAPPLAGLWPCPQDADALCPPAGSPGPAGQPRAGRGSGTWVGQPPPGAAPRAPRCQALSSLCFRASRAPGVSRARGARG